jgi:hypothetical protein
VRRGRGARATDARCQETAAWHDASNEGVRWPRPDGGWEYVREHGERDAREGSSPNLVEQVTPDDRLVTPSGWLGSNEGLPRRPRERRAQTRNDRRARSRARSRSKVNRPQLLRRLAPTRASRPSNSRSATRRHPRSHRLRRGAKRPRPGRRRAWSGAGEVVRRYEDGADAEGRRDSSTRRSATPRKVWESSSAVIEHLLEHKPRSHGGASRVRDRGYRRPPRTARRPPRPWRSWFRRAPGVSLVAMDTEAARAEERRRSWSGGRARNEAEREALGLAFWRKSDHPDRLVFERALLEHQLIARTDAELLADLDREGRLTLAGDANRAHGARSGFLTRQHPGKEPATVALRPLIQCQRVAHHEAVKPGRRSRPRVRSDPQGRA